MKMLPTISYLSDIYFSEGAINILPELVNQLQMRNPLVITDPGLVSLGMVDSLKVFPDQRRPVVFSGVETNPTELSTMNGLTAYKENDCDGIIAFGGGSPLDLAKCLGLLVHHPEPLEQYAILHGGTSKITDKFPPFIAIPTTAGSGSEIGRASLITLNNGNKLGFLSKWFLPEAVICDPELTLGMPPELAAGTGMDALSHCVEAYCSNKYNPIADAIALDGLSRGFKSIIEVVEDSRNIEARKEMMLASLQGGLAFQKGLGAVHALSHPLGALTNKMLHHGTLNAIFLPHVLAYNYSSCKEKMDSMARAIGLHKSQELPDKFTELNQRIGMPLKLREIGITKGELSPLSEKAFNDHCTSTNPRKLDILDFEKLYKISY